MRGIRGFSSLSHSEHVAPALADSFGTAFCIAVGLIAVSLVPALLLPRRLPSEREQRTSGPATEQRIGA